MSDGGRKWQEEAVRQGVQNIGGQDGDREWQKGSEVARSLGIHPNMLYSWKRKYAESGDKAFVGKGHLTDMAALRRKLRNADLDLEILRKAVGIFSKTTEDGSVL